MSIRLLTDVKRLAESNHPDVAVTAAPDFSGLSNYRIALKYFALMRQFDYLLLDFSTVIYYLGFFKLLAPWRRCKVASLDQFITHPDLCRSLPKKILRWERVLCLKGVDRIFLYSKNNAEFCRAYRIAPASSPMCRSRSTAVKRFWRRRRAMPATFSPAACRVETIRRSSRPAKG